MIVREHIENNLIKTYSDLGYMIQQDQTGALYSEAIDVENAPYTYTETNQMPPDDEISAEEALDILMGGEGHADDKGNSEEV